MAAGANQKRMPPHPPLSPLGRARVQERPFDPSTLLRTGWLMVAGGGWRTDRKSTGPRRVTGTPRKASRSPCESATLRNRDLDDHPAIAYGDARLSIAK